jgi:hypothetical protein
MGKVREHGHSKQDDIIATAEEAVEEQEEAAGEPAVDRRAYGS